MKGKETVELEEMNIILRIPKGAIRCEMNVSLLDEDGTIIKVGQTFSVSQIHDMREAFLDNVEAGDEYDSYYVFTDEATEKLKGVDLDA